jgi:hypothetical protein
MYASGATCYYDTWLFDICAQLHSNPAFLRHGGRENRISVEVSQTMMENVYLGASGCT